ncbi:hypothetical protein F7Q99_15955 [Streptomyces kaniharaensis]|uniref:Uncharacterized protein n=1 Tax=Streptomyces kaniharaensis TaxID=212423 RepID=A0A6N7KQ64_9ACTN|nr:hypothetical protein [Streptomyces kaniharaensis]MQS13722.1 hypothetical protein [Streptomyces kaniharaensis]
MPGDVKRGERDRYDDPVVPVEKPNVPDLVSAFGKQDVKVELETLTAFAKKVEALLQTMDGSAASASKLQAQTLSGATLISGDKSGEVVEAAALTAAYDKVHTKLVKLHSDLVSQVDAMKLAVGKTAGSYAGNEEATAAAHKAVGTNLGSATKATGANRPASDVGQSL